MFDSLEIFKMAQGMATHAATRQSVLAQNIANADTPGYRSRDLTPFSEAYRQSSGPFLPRATRAGHFSDTPRSTQARADVVKDAPTAPNGNSVSLETEMMKSAEAKMQHDMALGVYRSALTILRSSIAR